MSNNANTGIPKGMLSAVKAYQKFLNSNSSISKLTALDSEALQKVFQRVEFNNKMAQMLKAMSTKENMSTILQQYSRIIGQKNFYLQWNNNSFLEMQKKLHELEKPIINMQKAFDKEQWERINQLNYIKIVIDSANETENLHQMIESAYKKAINQMDESEETEDTAEDDTNKITDGIIENPIDFQKGLVDWCKGVKSKYTIICWIIYWFLQIFIVPFLQQKAVNITEKVYTSITDCVIKKSPEKKSDVISRIEKNSEVMVIENANYYYKVRFEDENGEEKEGFVAKRNLEVIEEQYKQSNQKKNKERKRPKMPQKE